MASSVEYHEDGTATVCDVDPESVDKTNILDSIVDMNTILDEQDVPEAQWIVPGIVPVRELPDV
jgi:hypothetical protein